MRPLAVAGNVNVDLIMGPFEPWPMPGSEVLAETDAVRPGGAAGNVALAWQVLGVPHQVAANTGDDLFADYLRAAFPDSAAPWPRAPVATTLSVGITHPDGERTFFTTGGHLGHLTFDQIVAIFDADRLGGGLLLLCGSFLMPAFAAAHGPLFDWAEAHGIDIAIDTGWPPGGWTGETVAMVRGWLPRCRHLLLNEAEVTALAGETDGIEAAVRLAPLLPEQGIVVVKQGPRGATAVGAEGVLAHAAAAPVTVIDTIGAGDVFNAGYLIGIAKDRPVAEALRLGVEAASTAISTEPRRYRAAEGRPLEGTSR